MASPGVAYIPEQLANYPLQASADCGSFSAEPYIPWYAIHTKGGHEQRAAANLKSFGIESYCPLLRTRVKHLFQPLFPGYIFARLKPQNFARVMNTRGAIAPVTFGGQAAEIDSSVIESIRQQTEILGSTNPGITIGAEVEITEGPFAGQIGTITREMSAHERVKVMLKAAFPMLIEVSRWEVTKA